MLQNLCRASTTRTYVCCCSTNKSGNANQETQHTHPVIVGQCFSEKDEDVGIVSKQVHPRIEPRKDCIHETLALPHRSHTDHNAISGGGQTFFVGPAAAAWWPAHIRVKLALLSYAWHKALAVTCECQSRCWPGNNQAAQGSELRVWWNLQLQQPQLQQCVILPQIRHLAWVRVRDEAGVIQLLADKKLLQQAERYRSPTAVVFVQCVPAAVDVRSLCSKHEALNAVFKVA